MKFNRLIPELNVADLAASLDFYVRVLGFRVEFERPDDKFAFLSYDGAQLMLEEDSESVWRTGEFSHPRGRGVNFEIETDELQILIERLNARGATFFGAPRENRYRTGEAEEIVREFLVQDPDGYLLRFQQTVGKNESND